ncbi:hypothetical protein JCM14244_17170 [Venenivibrio stagnispumantis]|uniref:Uncharacterized protein n=1 Tax=Venenivibrio stagnispumantis TaxID=407998 RepID=A0AA45WQ84_9AQUI|nr:hypothetical protein [Venenivibrio stagnispumantis]MCW4573962.1 hypothetical protein [Venenivibrio stagnispumantis]SMP22713.1 hypothetical protein SAMN06264868_12614 [Venenivibrio stagnispumantis]
MNIIGKNSEKSIGRIRSKEEKLRHYATNSHFDNIKAKQLPDFAKEIYKEDLSYVLLLVDKEDNIIDARIFKTKGTLENFIKDKHKKYGLDILLHPNPVKLTSKFWEKYRKTRNGIERLKLIKELKILEDKNIFSVNEIWVDIDSDFNQAFDVLNELVKFFNKNKYGIDITPAITLIKTKSGHLRFSFSIYSLNPHGKNKNGRTNLENIKEFVKIINAFFAKHGLKADATFTRINHPIWITKKQTVILEATHEVDFYLLFQKAKELKKEHKLYEEKPQKKEKSKKQKQLRHIPAFLANKFSKINEDYIFQKAVESLYNKNKNKGRYIYFLQTVAGWCKYLNKSYSEYYDIAYTYCPDKQKDIEIAWKYARELEFKTTENKDKYNFEELADKALAYLKEHKKAKRQELLKTIFFGQEWLEQEIMLQLKLNGLITETFERQNVGRPAKVYMIVEEQGKEEQKQDIITRQGKTSIREDMPANPCKIGFTQLITNKLSLDNLQYGGGWNLSPISVKISDKVFNVSDISFTFPINLIDLLKKENIYVSPVRACRDGVCEPLKHQKQPEQQQIEQQQRDKFQDKLKEEELKAFEEKKRKYLEQLSRDITEEEKQQLREKAEKEKQKKLEEEIRAIAEEIRKNLERTYQKKLESLQPKKPAVEKEPAIFISIDKRGQEEREPDKNNQIKDEKQDLGATGKTSNEQEKTKKYGPQKQDYELLPSKDDYLHKPSKTAIKKLKLYRKKYRAILNYSWKRLKKDEVLFFLINNEKLIAERGIKDILKTLKYADLDEKILNPVGWLITRFNISLKNSRFLYLIT